MVKNRRFEDEESKLQSVFNAMSVKFFELHWGIMFSVPETSIFNVALHWSSANEFQFEFDLDSCDEILV